MAVIKKVTEAVIFMAIGADLFKLSAGSDRVIDFNSSEGGLIAIRSGLA